MLISESTDSSFEGSDTTGLDSGTGPNAAEGFNPEIVEDPKNSTKKLSGKAETLHEEGVNKNMSNKSQSKFDSLFSKIVTENEDDDFGLDLDAGVGDADVGDDLGFDDEAEEFSPSGAISQIESLLSQLKTHLGVGGDELDVGGDEFDDIEDFDGLKEAVDAETPNVDSIIAQLQSLKNMDTKGVKTVNKSADAGSGTKRDGTLGDAGADSATAKLQNRNNKLVQGSGPAHVKKTGGASAQEE